MNNTLPVKACKHINWWTAKVEGLDRKDRDFLAILQDEARGHAECWSGVETLAAKVEYSVRWVQQRIAKYMSLGLLDIVVDYTLKTRRRIVLLWRKAAKPTPTPAPQPAEGAMRDDRQPVARRPEPAAAIAEAPALDAPRGGDATEVRKATPEEVRELTEAAAKVEGSTPSKARVLAKLCTLTVVLAAARRAASQGKGWGWVVRTANAWKAEGVPEFARLDAPRAKTQAEVIEELFGPGGKYAESTFDMTPYLHLRLNDD